MGAAPNKSADDPGTFFDLLFDGPTHVWEGRTKAAEDGLQATEPLSPGAWPGNGTCSTTSS